MLTQKLVCLDGIILDDSVKLVKELAIRFYFGSLPSKN